MILLIILAGIALIAVGLIKMPCILKGGLALVLGLFMTFIVAMSITRIESGEVGLRINFDKTTSSTELLPGSFNQTLVGDVITFKVQDVATTVDNLTPLAADNSTMRDFDVTIVYSINPGAVSDLWITKNKSFHATVDGDVLLMQNYIALATRNAVYKSARNQPALGMADNRQQIEQQIRESILATLAEEELNNSISVSQVQIRAIVPADIVIQSANELVRAQNELKTKEVEVQTAKKEAERISALNANSGAIGYMNAMANMKIAEGVASGKINTIVVPYDFKGIVNASK